MIALPSPLGARRVKKTPRCGVFSEGFFEPRQAVKRSVIANRAGATAPGFPENEVRVFGGSRLAVDEARMLMITNPLLSGLCPLAVPEKNLRVTAVTVLDFFRPLRFPRFASSAPGGAKLVYPSVGFAATFSNREGKRASIARPFFTPSGNSRRKTIHAP